VFRPAFDRVPEAQTRIDRLRATAASFAVVLAYSGFVLVAAHPSMRSAWEAMGPITAGGWALWLVCALAAAEWMLLARARRPGPRAGPAEIFSGYLRARWAEDFGVSLLWPPLMFGLLVGSFGLFKQEVLVKAGFGFDPMFRMADRFMFLGIDPWRITHALPSPWTSLVLDRIYHGWFAPMSLGLILCAFVRRPVRARTQYMLAFALSWIVIGSLMAYLLPSAGPCYWGLLTGRPGPYDALMSGLYADQAKLQAGLHGSLLGALSEQAYLLSLYRGAAVGVGGGISAMPSMHVALAALFACAAFRLGRVWGWLAAAYAALVFVASVHLAWHYAVDGVVGAGAAILIWRLSGYLAAAVLSLSPTPRAADLAPASVKVVARD
jgi:hypothetical protein